MSQHEISKEREAVCVRKLGRPGAGPRKEKPRWEELGYPDPEAHMIVQRKRMRRIRMKQPLFRNP